MDRSITTRNFWGGFWGGVLGILATAKFGILALMGGCLVGVMLGFYYQELGRLAVSSWNAAWLKLLGPQTQPSFAEQWAALHPFDRAQQIKKTAMLAAGVLLVGIEILFLSWLFPHAKDSELLFFIFLLTLGSVAIGSVARFAREPDERSWDADNVRYYFRVQDLYGRLGGLKFFGREVVIGFASFLFFPALLGGLMAGVAGLLAFMVFAWPAALALGGIAFLGLFAFGFMRGAYHLAMKPDHWSCLMVTIVTTGLIAWAGHSYLEGVALAFTALIAGLLSGFGAVQVHSVLHRVFERRPRLARFFARRFGQHGAMLLEMARALVSPRRYQLKVRDVLAQAVR
jgi:hypothetical protein